MANAESKMSLVKSDQSTALVTGASSGIGLEMARELAQRGYDLVLSARSVNALEELSQELTSRFQVRVWVIPADLSETGSAQKLFDHVEKEKLNISILINNAGSGASGPFMEMHPTKIHSMMVLNMVSLTELTRLFSEKWVKNKTHGRILNVASTAAFQPGPYMAVYYATKAYVYSLSEAVAEEFRSQGITVTTLCPGPTLSGFANVAGTANTPLFKMNPMVATSHAVAIYGINGMLKGKRVLIYGWVNAIQARMIGFFPRTLLGRVVGMLNGGGK